MVYTMTPDDLIGHCPSGSAIAYYAFVCWKEINIRVCSLQSSS